MRRFALLLLFTLLAAGCAPLVAAPVPHASPTLPAETPVPTVTFFDINQRQRDAQNVADMLAATATADALNRIATQSVIVAATQQVEQFNAQATQQAVSVRATATAAQLALDQQRAAVTMTAQAIAQRDAQATAQAETLAQQRSAREEQERAREQAALDWQTGYVVKLAFSALAVIALAILIYHASRLLAVGVAIQARRWLLLDRLQFDPTLNRWVLIDAAFAPALPAGDDAHVEEHDRLREVVQRAVEQGRAVSDDVVQERARRAAWKAAARDFLRWGERVGFSQPAMMAAGVSDAAWRQMIAFLSALGLLVKSGPYRTAPWTLPYREDGAPTTVREALQSTIWLTSFETPERFPPPLPLPPARQFAPLTVRPNRTEADEPERRPEPPEVEALAGEVVGAAAPRGVYASRLATEFPPELHIEPASRE